MFNRERDRERERGAPEYVHAECARMQVLYVQASTHGYVRTQTPQACRHLLLAAAYE